MARFLKLVGVNTLPGHFVALCDQYIAVSSIVFLGNDPLFLPQAHGACGIFLKAGQIVVILDLTAGLGAKVVGVIGHKEIVHVRYAVDVLIGLRSGAGAVGVGSMVMKLTEEEGLLKFMLLRRSSNGF